MKPVLLTPAFPALMGSSGGQNQRATLHMLPPNPWSVSSLELVARKIASFSAACYDMMKPEGTEGISIKKEDAVWLTD